MCVCVCVCGSVSVSVCVPLQEAGLPVGGPDFNPFVMLEVHYNNPGLISGKVGFITPLHLP